MVRRRLLLAVCLLAAGGCGPRIDPGSIPVVVPDSFSASGDHAPPAAWWTELGDPTLDALIDSALTRNLELDAAWHRLRAASAVVERTSGDRWPALDVVAEASLTDGSPDPEDDATVELGLASSYELDLWGRVGSTVDAERSRARASQADYRTAALSVSAAITETWVRLAEALDQLALVDEQIATNEDVLRLLENRLGTGLIRSVDVLRQRQLVAARREERSAAAARVTILRHRLAVLLGRPPRDALAASPSGIPTIPPLPETGVPLELLRRRPDVERAHHLLAAADHDLAAAIQSRYPRITLGASASTFSGNGATLFDDWIANLVGGLVAPIFRGGELRAEVTRTEAVARQRVAEYGQAVLVAVQEVEDALVREADQRERITWIEEQVRLAGQAYERLRTEYLNGTASYLEVLTALDEAQELRRDALTARRGLVESRIGLYRALAGPVPVPPKEDGG